MDKISMIDNIIYLDTHRIITERRLTMSEDVFGDHFPLFPVLPGVLLLEMISQSLTLFLESFQFPNFFELNFEKVKFQNYARPGDCLTAEIVLKKETIKEYTFSADIKTDTKLIAKIKKIKIIKKGY